MLKPIDLRQLLKKIHALLDIEWVYEEGKPATAPLSVRWSVGVTR